MDTDGDGVDDGTEVGDAQNPNDTDQDGQIDALDSDDDGDGINTAEEINGDDPPPDTDNDGTPDHLDLDSDNDGTPDELEGTGDSDCDGIRNFQDPIIGQCDTGYGGLPTGSTGDTGGSASKEDPGGCGCQTGPASSFGWILLAAPLLALRRRDD